MNDETRDILLRIPRDAPMQELPALIAAGLRMQFRPKKPPIYVATRRRSASTPPAAA